MPHMRIVFMGTPYFAVPALRAINARGHEIALVVTQPDRRAGRGRKLCCPPVKDAAVELGLPVDQRRSVNCEEFVGELSRIEPDAVVVVAFGQILCEEILEAPRLGAVNLHASLLPEYRGVAPINWAIVEGKRETGVTTMFMEKKVDAGEIILRRSTPIGDDETAGELTERLADMGAELLVETLELLGRGDAPRQEQDRSRASYARKLTKADGEIDWSLPAQAVHDHIRGMTPWPGAWTRFRGRTLKVLRAGLGAKGGSAGAPGEIVSVDEDNGIEVAVGEGTVRLLRLQPEGRPAMEASAFVCGYRPDVGSRPFGDAAGEGE